jgi:hypothetical protein
MVAVRRVRRIIRKIDPWTVLKVSFVLYAIVALAMVLGVVIVWAVAKNVGIPQGIDEVAIKLTLLDQGDSIFEDTERWFLIVVFLGVVWTVASTGITTLAAVMYNLVSDVVGGVEVVVLEETYNVPQAAAVRTPQQWVGATQAAPPTEEPSSPLVDLPTQETDVLGSVNEEPEDAEAPGDDGLLLQDSDEYAATESPDRTAASTKASGAS